MRALRRFEQKLEDMVTGAFARAFRSAVQPVEIAAALQREADNNAQILSRQRRLVPNAFTVELSPSDSDRLTEVEDALRLDLIDQLHDHADHQGYSFPGPVTIAFDSADDLVTGRFRITSRHQAGVHERRTPYDDSHQASPHDNRSHTDAYPGSTPATPVSPASPASPARTRRASAWVEINGQRHRLDSHTTVGRGTEADLRINDPGISRKHAVFELIYGTADDTSLDVIVADLGSTNGVLVNGHRVERAQLRDGDQLRMGHTELTFSLRGGDA